jgi:hypothetical protein
MRLAQLMCITLCWDLCQCAGRQTDYLSVLQSPAIVLYCRLLCPALFSLPWAFGTVFSHVQQQPTAAVHSATGACRRPASNRAAAKQLQPPSFRRGSPLHLSARHTRAPVLFAQQHAPLWTHIKLTTHFAAGAGAAAQQLAQHAGHAPTHNPIRQFTGTSSSWSEAAPAAAADTHGPSPTTASPAAEAAAAAADSASMSAAQHLEISDTLKLAACIRRFKSRGHLVSQLDPLGRTPGGPWLGPIGDAYTR